MQRILLLAIRKFREMSANHGSDSSSHKRLYTGVGTDLQFGRKTMHIKGRHSTTNRKLLQLLTLLGTEKVAAVIRQVAGNKDMLWLEGEEVEMLLVPLKIQRRARGFVLAPTPRLPVVSLELDQPVSQSLIYPTRPKVPPLALHKLLGRSDSDMSTVGCHLVELSERSARTDVSSVAEGGKKPQQEPLTPAGNEGGSYKVHLRQSQIETLLIKAGERADMERSHPSSRAIGMRGEILKVLHSAASLIFGSPPPRPQDSPRVTPLHSLHMDSLMSPSVARRTDSDMSNAGLQRSLRQATGMLMSSSEQPVEAEDDFSKPDGGSEEISRQALVIAWRLMPLLGTRGRVKRESAGKTEAEDAWFKEEVGGGKDVDEFDAFSSPVDGAHAAKGNAVYGKRPVDVEAEMTSTIFAVLSDTAQAIGQWQVRAQEGMWGPRGGSGRVGGLKGS